MTLRQPPVSEARDREIAVRAGTARGESARELSVRVGVTERTVCRIRARLREQGKL